MADAYLERRLAEEAKARELLKTTIRKLRRLLEDGKIMVSYDSGYFETVDEDGADSVISVENALNSEHPQAHCRACALGAFIVALSEQAPQRTGVFWRSHLNDASESRRALSYLDLGRGVLDEIEVAFMAASYPEHRGDKDYLAFLRVVNPIWARESTPEEEAAFRYFPRHLSPQERLEAIIRQLEETGTFSTERPWDFYAETATAKGKP